MRLKLLVPRVLLATTSISFLISCDKEYDLSKDINTDLKIGEYFSVPVGKTTEVKLSRIIKESESIKPNANSIYEVVTSGRTTTSIDLSAVEVNITPYIGSTNIELPNLPQPVSTKSTTIDLPMLSIQSSPYDVDTQLPKEVEALYRANLTNSDTYLTISIGSDEWPSGIDRITLTDFTITFPKIIESSQGSNIFKIQRPIMLSSANSAENIKIPITAIDIPSDRQGNYIIGQSGNKRLKLNESLQISANVNTEISSIPTQRNVPINFSYTAGNPVNIKDVSGVFYTSANINEVIEINDIPDFLKNGHSFFKPNEVNFILSLNNPINIPWSLSLGFQSTKNDESQISEKVNVPINISQGANQLLISNSTEADVYVENLPTLFNFVPDKFSITSPEDIKLSCSNTSQTIELAKSYIIDAKYDVAIPFSFSNFEIEYIDKIDNLEKDLYDVLDVVDTDVIFVTASAESTIPANLNVAVNLLDASGNSINDGISVDLQECVVYGAEVSDNSKAKVSPIKVKLSQTKEGYFKKLDKIEYTLNAVNDDYPMSLRSDQHICIKNIVAKIPNGIKVKL